MQIEQDINVTDSTRPHRRNDGTWQACTAASLGIVWVSVIAISVFAPDLVHGSEQQRLPLAAMITWIWGAFATAAVLLTMIYLRDRPNARSIWVGFAASVAVIWVAAAVLAIALPEFETGSDPTLIPFGAIVFPLVAALLTALAGGVAALFGHDDQRTSSPES